MPSEFRIRLAVAEDAPFIPVIERDAARAFAQSGLLALDGYGLSAAVIDAAIRSKHAWIAESPNGERVGFLLAGIVDGRAHLTEVSVCFAWQRLGIGRSLITTFLDWAHVGHYEEATLISFRDLGFNAPFYASFGFRELTIGSDRPELASLRHSEHGLDLIASRIAMHLLLE